MHIAGVLLSTLSVHAEAQFDHSGGVPLNDPATATLISRENGFVPGEVTHLAVRYQIADHWHIYWNGLNDSGLPPAITLDLPEGYEALPTRWPAPKRYILGDNDLIDHVLEGEVLAVIPVRVPSDASPGGVVRVTGESDWLVCEEACLPGRASLSIELPVVAEAGDTEYAEAFRRAQRQTPVVLPGDGSKLGLSLAWEDRTLVVRSDQGGRIEFYPHATGTPLVDRFSDPQSDHGELRIRLQTDGPLRGVLRLTRPEDDPRPDLIAIDLAVESTKNDKPSPAIGWRPWVESLDGPHPSPRRGGTHDSGRPEGRGG